MTQYNARTADKFVIRLREGQRERLRQRAEDEFRSMNDLCLIALERYLEQGDAFDRLLLAAGEGLQALKMEALEQV